MKRDEAWLQQMLDKIWDNYFQDVPQDNDVRIVFGRRAKRRLGSISLDTEDGKTSLIVVNSIFKDPSALPLSCGATESISQLTPGL